MFLQALDWYFSHGFVPFFLIIVDSTRWMLPVSGAYQYSFDFGVDEGWVDNVLPGKCEVRSLPLLLSLFILQLKSLVAMVCPVSSCNNSTKYYKICDLTKIIVLPIGVPIFILTAFDLNKQFSGICMSLDRKVSVKHTTLAPTKILQFRILYFESVVTFCLFLSSSRL